MCVCSVRCHDTFHPVAQIFPIPALSGDSFHGQGSHFTFDPDIGFYCGIAETHEGHAEVVDAVVLVAH